MFAFHESCELTPILLPAAETVPIPARLVCLAIISLSGCWSELKERSYDAPKIESEFVAGREPKPRQPSPPMMGASKIPLQDRRILGAVIPDANNVYFVKATDRIARVASAAAAFRSIVERFAIDPGTGSLKFDLPTGWSLKLLDNANAGIGLAEMIAEINFEAVGGPMRFTVSKYDRPTQREAWEEYLLSQINRWRGQLELAPVRVSDLQTELPIIPRNGATLPAYIFDANGSDAGFPPSTFQPSTTQPTTIPSELSAAQSQTTQSSTKPPLKLVYDKPVGWELQAERAYREATFKITKDAKEGEVTVSTARDSPMQNAAMWIGQVMPNNDPTTFEALAKKTVDEAEPLQTGTKAAKLYSIRASDQPDARSLLVVAIPMENDGMSMFVKLNCELRMMEEVKSTFLSFVNSLRWE